MKAEDGGVLAVSTGRTGGVSSGQVAAESPSPGLSWHVDASGSSLRGLTLGAWGGRVLGARPQQPGSFGEAEEPQGPRGDRPHLAEELTRTEPATSLSKGLPAGHPQAPGPQRAPLTPTPP